MQKPSFCINLKLFENTSTPFTSLETVRISRDVTLTVHFKYTSDYVESFGSNNETIILVIIILLFIILDSVVILFYILYHRKKEREDYSELQRQNSYISKMINYVNHEIRNPLNSILGIIDLMRMDFIEKGMSPEDPLISNLNTAYNSCILIQHIVNDVLDVKKLEQGKLDLYPSKIELDEFCKNLKKLLEPKIQEHIQLNFSVDCEVDEMYVDSQRLTQILLNLVTNSFKFTHEGFIHLSIMPSQDNVIFKVIDTGCGISDSKVVYLFQPFSQLQDQQVSRTGGYGLGLYLCKMLVKLMQGDIQFIDNEDKGSTFQVVLPKIYKPVDNIEKIL